MWVSYDGPRRERKEDGRATRGMRELQRSVITSTFDTVQSATRRVSERTARIAQVGEAKIRSVQRPSTQKGSPRETTHDPTR